MTPPAAWHSSRRLADRSACFVLFLGLTLALFSAPLTTLIKFSFQQEEYSHVILIPMLSASLLLLERKRMFSRTETQWAVALPLLVTGVLVYSFGQRYSASLSQNDHLSIATLGVVVIWLSGL